MPTFYAISYDVTKDSTSRETIEQFFLSQKGNSMKLSETSFLIFCNEEIIKVLCRQIDIDKKKNECFSIVKIDNPQTIECENIDNSPIKKFIDTMYGGMQKISTYSPFIQNSSN